MTRVGGLARFLRGPHLRARVLAVTDSRTAVRVAFLASAEQLGLIEVLGDAPMDQEGVGRALGLPSSTRLAAWLRVGVELGELRERDGVYRLSGTRIRAMGAGDEVLRAQYRSFHEYQFPTYEQLQALLRDGRRTDLGDHATTIALVSRAAEPFVASFLRVALRGAPSGSLLDVGCGTGVYLEHAARTRPALRVLGVDRDGAVVTEARDRIAAAGLADRVEVRQADVRDLDPYERFEVITLLNTIYYFPADERVALFRTLRSHLRERGRLVLASMVVPGSIAAAHLDLMLRVQEGRAALPSRRDLRRDLGAAGYRRIRVRPLVPSEPFVGIMASAR